MLFLILLYDRDTAYVKTVDEGWRLSGQHYLSMQRSILDHLCQLVNGIRMQPQFRFVNDDYMRHCLLWLQKQSGQSDETDRTIRELFCIEHIVVGSIVSPLQGDIAAFGLKIEITELRYHRPHITNYTLIRLLIVFPQEVKERSQVIGFRLQVMGRIHSRCLSHGSRHGRVTELIHLTHREQTAHLSTHLMAGVYQARLIVVRCHHASVRFAVIIQATPLHIFRFDDESVGNSMRQTEIIHTILLLALKSQRSRNARSHLCPIMQESLIRACLCHIHLHTARHHISQHLEETHYITLSCPIGTEQYIDISKIQFQG